MDTLTQIRKWEDKGKIKPLMKSYVYGQMGENERREAEHALTRLGGKDPGPLLKMLGNNDEPMRIAAVKILGEAKNAQAVQPLIDMLRIGTSVFKEIVAALAQIGEPAVKPLLDALHGEGWILLGAEAALGDIGDARAVEPLIKLLESRFWEARGMAAEALGKIGDTRAAGPIIQLLADEKKEVRFEATKVLDAFDQADIMEPLFAALQDRKDRIRVSAVSKLFGTRDARAVEPFIRALADRDALVRKTAAEALGVLGDKRAIDPLIKAVADQEEIVSSSAQKALKVIGVGADREQEIKENIEKHNHIAEEIRKIREKAVESFKRLGIIK